MCGKSRLSHIITISIPCLELQGAFLAATIEHNLRTELFDMTLSDAPGIKMKWCWIISKIPYVIIIVFNNTIYCVLLYSFLFINSAIPI